MRIDVSIPNAVSGDWEVKDLIITEEMAKFDLLRNVVNGRDRHVPEGKYKQLLHHGEIVMTNTPAEIRDHKEFIMQARKGGEILIAGLGLGMCLTAILRSRAPLKITVIEKEIDVIKLVSPSFEKERRVRIIHSDILKWNRPKSMVYDYVWIDIWNSISVENLEDMEALGRIYRSISSWLGFWCEYECIDLAMKGNQW